MRGVIGRRALVGTAAVPFPKADSSGLEVARNDRRSSRQKFLVRRAVEQPNRRSLDFARDDKSLVRSG